jgi:hypothetical protein
MPVFFLLIVISLLFSVSNDVETNTGPINNSSRYIYGTMATLLHENKKGWYIYETCDQWIRIY